MDYMKFVEYHREQGADITVGCLPVDYERASDFGLMNIDQEGVVTVSFCLCLLAALDSLDRPCCSCLYIARTARQHAIDAYANSKATCRLMCS